MTVIYRSKHGDTLSAITKKHYGTLKGRLFEQVLDFNPGLACKGAILPDGVLIALPEIEMQIKEESIVLWE
ncbi:MAG: phage tail protein [Desulfobacteraceae bacterium]|nr:phage tail protein [Desulfobacteraceae bacterium]